MEQKKENTVSAEQKQRVKEMHKDMVLGLFYHLRNMDLFGSQFACKLFIIAREEAASMEDELVREKFAELVEAKISVYLNGGGLTVAMNSGEVSVVPTALKALAVAAEMIEKDWNFY